jgi:hypothetical protein
MSGRMNWRKALLRGKPTLDWREREDAAARWLRRHENSPAELRRRARAICEQLGESLTADSSEVPPW